MPIQLLRIVRNGVVALGRFDSSPVHSIELPFVHTANSIYKLMLVKSIELHTEDLSMGPLE